MHILVGWVRLCPKGTARLGHLAPRLVPRASSRALSRLAPHSWPPSRASSLMTAFSCLISHDCRRTPHPSSLPSRASSFVPHLTPHPWFHASCVVPHRTPHPSWLPSRTSSVVPHTPHPSSCTPSVVSSLTPHPVSRLVRAGARRTNGGTCVGCHLGQEWVPSGALSIVRTSSITTSPRGKSYSRSSSTEETTICPSPAGPKMGLMKTRHT